MRQDIEEMQASHISTGCRREGNNPGHGSWIWEPNTKHLETHVMFDLYIMAVNRAERDEQEWKKIFVEAGFKDYKILPVLGILSVIEVYLCLLGEQRPP